MPIPILMPALSPTMTEGNLAKWIKKEGDKIKPGEVIAEIETDKATMEVEAVDGGILAKIVIPGNTEGVTVNRLIAVLLEEGESVDSVAAFLESQGSGAQSAAEKPDAGKPQAPDIKPAADTSAKGGERIKASPLARRTADILGVDLSGISGTGPHGRIIKADVEEANTQKPASRQGGAMMREQVEYEDIPLNNMRKTIAKRLLESKQNIPHFYLNIDVELDEVLNARVRLNKAAEKAAGKQAPAYRLTVNDFVIKACAAALKSVPEANSAWADNAIRRFNNVDISVAVAIDGGLITPVLRNADAKSLSEISIQMKELIAKARENKLKPEEFQGGGFSISNLGMYGIKNFQAIINPPQSAILAVGASEERVVVKAGQMVVRNIVSLSLSSDHRVVDGAVGAQFLSALKTYLEDPMMMLA